MLVKKTPLGVFFESLCMMKSKFFYLFKFIILMLLSLVLLAIAIYTSFTYESDNLEITFIDVGQGDCAYIKTPDMHRIIIDGGDVGAYDEYIKPYLGRKRISHINSAVVTHFHSDHASGILELMEQKQVDRVYAPKTKGNTVLIDAKLQDACENSGAKYIKREIGEFIYNGDDGVKIKAWFPNDVILDNTGDDYNENNNSLVLMLEYAGKKALFTGDIEEDAEDVLVDYVELDADILKVPHHGSDVSSTEEFIDKVSPQYAVIQCGVNNEYGFPHKVVLNRLEERSVEVLRTDLDGDITFVIDKRGNIKVNTSK